MGDATELAALAEVFPAQLPGGRKIPLGSVKANLGHTLETAGVAGMAKVILAMEHALIPPVANLVTPNPAVPWDRLSFYLPRRAERWERPEGGCRRAAVNSFGIGGLNIHVVVEEHVPEGAPSYPVPALPNDEQPAATAHEPIAVIGMGAILPGADTVKAFLDLLADGRDPKSDVTPDRWNPDIFYSADGPQPYRSPTKRGGFVTGYHYDWRRHRVPPKQVEKANPLQFMLLDATEQALRQAGYLEKAVRPRADGGRRWDAIRRRFLQSAPSRTAAARVRTATASPARVAGYARDATGAGRRRVCGAGPATHARPARRNRQLHQQHAGVADHQDVRSEGRRAEPGRRLWFGPGGAGRLRRRASQRRLRSDVVRRRAAPHGCPAVRQLATRRRAALGEPAPAYDEQSAGYVPGEGCAVLLLQRLSDAERDGNRVLGVVREVAASTDFGGRGNSLRKALQRVVDATGTPPEEILAVEAVGTVPSIEACEVAAVRRRGRHARPPRARARSIRSTSQFGFMGAVHGLAGIIKATAAVASGRIAGRRGRRRTRDTRSSPRLACGRNRTPSRWNGIRRA